MKKRIVSSILAASFLVVLSVAFAHAGSTARMNVTVPFAFSVGNVSFAAGDYTISETSYSSLLLIQSKQTNHSSYILTYPGEGAGHYGNARIHFRHYADQYFLSQVFDGLGDDSRRLPVSRLEKDFVGAAHLTANNSWQPDVIVVGTR
jgi:hypothetical protein